MGNIESSTEKRIPNSAQYNYHNNNNNNICNVAGVHFSGAGWPQKGL